MHAVDNRRGTDEGISVRAWVRDMKLCATLRDSGVNRQNSPRKRGKDMTVKPFAKYFALRYIAPFDKQYSPFQLKNGNRRKKDTRNRNAF